ncbi:hypothetical protein CL176_07705 [Suicoccus acidiformans]|uniref:Terminase ATPase subunit N-terminal domain-containing protein n=1 Tax=Suicoccus acidiformans TaxID=2036206 RepID=A0A347WLD4_9LACT|nr:helix-turn-helix domain-containing protein [Suicoccus acidiformans]AXY25891.1 hypothetical protein CL176_07705 [Suicoccus acidiformans]
MDIWILVIVLLAIAIVLLVASFFAEDDVDVEERINEYSVQQSQELYNVKTRLAELEQQTTFAPVAGPTSDTYPEEGEPTIAYEEDVLEVGEEIAVEPEAVSDEAHQQIIQLYSQGYTMHEISQAVNLNTITIQNVVDDYIENR